MTKLMLIVNPKAGKIKSRNRLYQLVRTFNEDPYQCHLYVTKKPNDAKVMVQKFAKNYQGIITVGGDGTLNEVITGMMSSALQLPIGYLPAGTTNDFAKSQNLPKQLKEAISVIKQGSPTPIDVGQFNDSYFSYVASFGAFTEISYKTPQPLKNRWGYLAYLMQIPKHASSVTSYPVKFQTEDSWIDETVLFFSISNATSIGGFIHLKKDEIQLDDGHMELFYIRYPKKISQWISVLRGIATKNYTSSSFVVKSIQSINVQTSASLHWCLDGEDGGVSEDSYIQTKHQSIRILK